MSTEPEKAPKRILVCDDDADIVLLLATILEDAGYQVETASGHREFSAKFDPTSPPNLILMDVRMPERDGFSIAENLGGRVPIIFVTAHDRPVYRLYAPIAGGIDYITKPFEPEDLLKRIEKALRVDPRKSNWFLQFRLFLRPAALREVGPLTLISQTFRARSQPSATLVRRLPIHHQHGEVLTRLEPLHN